MDNMLLNADDMIRRVETNFDLVAGRGLGRDKECCNCITSLDARQWLIDDHEASCLPSYSTEAVSMEYNCCHKVDALQPFASRTIQRV
jgi:hypothetical protein